jgi:hypothetical protein
MRIITAGLALSHYTPGLPTALGRARSPQRESDRQHFIRCLHGAPGASDERERRCELTVRPGDDLREQLRRKPRTRL